MTEERRQEIIKNIHDYCVENIINFEAKASIAWDDMDHWRAPLSFVNSSLNDEIEEYAATHMENLFKGNFNNKIKKK